MEKANIILSEEAALSLRELAASLDFYIKRGVGTGEIGNIRSILELVATRFRTEPSYVEDVFRKLVKARCPIHGDELGLSCAFCGYEAIEATRTHRGYAMWKEGVLGDEVERRLRRRVIRSWGDGEYGIVQTSLDYGEWQGDEERDEEDLPVHGYKLSVPITYISKER